MFDNNLKNVHSYPMIYINNNDTNKSFNSIDHSNQLRQRIAQELIPSINLESIEITKKSQSNSSQRSCYKNLLIMPIFIFTIYFLIQYMNTSVVPSRTSNWHNASEYLTKNLIGQDQPLKEFKHMMEQHKNFTIIVLEV